LVARRAENGQDLLVPAYDAEIQSLLNWSHVWISVARERVDAAYAARALFEIDPSGSLTAEFHAGLVAVAAAAFAIQAEQLKVLGERSPTRAKPPPHAWPVNSGDWLAQFLREKGSIDSVTAERLGQLFDLRHKSVHPIATQQGLVPHPVGTNTSPEVVAYNADVARDAAELAETVVAALST
jgi:hypothetical protein